MKRRNFFATLLAPLIAKVCPTLGRTTVSSATSAAAAAPLPPFTLAGLQEAYNSCCYGKEHPEVIWMGADAWKSYLTFYPDKYKYFMPNGRLRQQGYAAIAFNDAEVACDPLLEPDAVAIRGGRYGALGIKERFDVAPV